MSGRERTSEPNLNSPQIPFRPATPLLDMMQIIVKEMIATEDVLAGPEIVPFVLFVVGATLPVEWQKKLKAEAKTLPPGYDMPQFISGLREEVISWFKQVEADR